MKRRASKPRNVCSVLCPTRIERRPDSRRILLSMNNAPQNLVLGCVLAAGLSGCIADHNSRPEVGSQGSGRGTEISELNPPDTRAEVALKSDSPSATSLNRTGWQRTEVLVPVDGTYTFPRYARNHVWTDSTTRQRAEPFTPLSALELDGETGWTQTGELMASPVLAVWDGVLILPRMLFVAPWKEVRTLPESYARTPTGVATTTPAPARGAEPER